MCTYVNLFNLTLQYFPLQHIIYKVTLHPVATHAPLPHHIYTILYEHKISRSAFLFCIILANILQVKTIDSHEFLFVCSSRFNNCAMNNEKVDSNWTLYSYRPEIYSFFPIVYLAYLDCTYFSKGVSQCVFYLLITSSNDRFIWYDGFLLEVCHRTRE